MEYSELGLDRGLFGISKNKKNPKVTNCEVIYPVCYRFNIQPAKYYILQLALPRDSKGHRYRGMETKHLFSSKDQIALHALTN